MGWGWFQLIPLRRCDQPIKQGKYGNEPAISSEWGYHQWRPYGKKNSLGSAKYVYIYIHIDMVWVILVLRKNISIHLRQFQRNQGISLHKTVLSPPFDPCNGQCCHLSIHVHPGCVADGVPKDHTNPTPIVWRTSAVCWHDPRQFNSGHGLEAIPFPFSTWQSVSSSACVRGHAMPAVCEGTRAEKTHIDIHIDIHIMSIHVCSIFFLHLWHLWRLIFMDAIYWITGFFDQRQWGHQLKRHRRPLQCVAAVVPALFHSCGTLWD